jgi:hypothetical protein
MLVSSVRLLTRLCCAGRAQILAQNGVPASTLADISGDGAAGVLDHEALFSMGVAKAADRMAILSLRESAAARRAAALALVGLAYAHRGGKCVER